MQEVAKDDQRWQVTVEWSPHNPAFTVTLQRWEREYGATSWTLEDVRVLPMVSHQDLQDALDRTWQRLAQEMAERGAADLRPF